jgi:hypothetical protein
VLLTANTETVACELHTKSEYSPEPFVNDMRYSWGLGLFLDLRPGALGASSSPYVVVHSSLSSMTCTREPECPLDFSPSAPQRNRAAIADKGI